MLKPQNTFALFNTVLNLEKGVTQPLWYMAEYLFEGPLGAEVWISNNNLGLDAATLIIKPHIVLEHIFEGLFWRCNK